MRRISLLFRVFCYQRPESEHDGYDGHPELFAIPRMMFPSWQEWRCLYAMPLQWRGQNLVQTFVVPFCFRTTASCIGFYGSLGMPERLIIVRVLPASPEPKAAEYLPRRQRAQGINRFHKASLIYRVKSSEDSVGSNPHRLKPIVSVVLRRTLPPSQHH